MVYQNYELSLGGGKKLDLAARVVLYFGSRFVMGFYNKIGRVCDYREIIE